MVIPSPREVLLFTLEEQRYALPVEDVRELVRAVRLTPLPQAPDVVEGLFNLRGELIPVLDLRRRFRLSARRLRPSDHFIIAQAGPRPVALRVDRAEGLLRLEADTLDATPRHLPGVGYVAGALKLPDGLVLLHDLRTFLSEAEALKLNAALVKEESSR
ncbi:chemotaxis protein CheW [Melittangium boletus]|uniref:Positive regulator of CheA protein activity (CheW) n=1 Tax=Melittangium boletus DSM 14713 TaxID=1294270 RepID=A0A250IDJ8_9BACT|nr:chemotaxis protein CheW [Melittangium boletus]ATB29221.1 Positive regulator of CheA protein activity (CheW) [Melittangium boletus DSM 14713]